MQNTEATIGGENIHPPNPRKAALSAWIGSALEYYDFFIYGTAAALVFPTLFFPDASPFIGTLASFATFGVAYVARPLGAFVLGHLGDTLGRKLVLVFTLLAMGACTALIGLLPTYGQVGILAPILLVLLRVLQGFAVSGEQSSATSMTLEHSPAGRRAFFTSFTLSGTQFGFILATVIFLPFAALPEEQFLAWGWRIPFLLSVVVVAVGWWIRRTLNETPVFEAEQQQHEVPRVPLKLLFRDYKSEVLKVVFAALYSVISTIFSIYALSYGVETMGIARSTMLWILVLANVVGVVAIPTWGILGDRIGRKPVFIFGALGGAVTIWPFIWSISQKNIPLMFVFGILLSGVIYSAVGGVGLAMFPEQFEAKVRLSGMAVGTQIGFALGGFSPLIAASLAGPELTRWVPVALFTCVAAVLSASAALLMRETSKVPMHDLGKHARVAASELK